VTFPDGLTFSIVSTSLTLIPSPTLTKTIAKVSLFYIIYVYKTHWTYSPFFISSTDPPPFPQVRPIHTHKDLFDLSFISNSKVIVQRDFSMYSSCEYTVLRTVQHPLLLSLSPSLLPLLFNSCWYILLLDPTS
jgi:hypothetical protein